MKQTILALLAVISLGSCQITTCGVNKEQFLDNYERFVASVNDRDLSYRSEDWKALDEKYKKFTKECYPEYRDQMTQDEKERYYGASIKYYAYKYGKSFKKLSENEGEALVNALENELDDAFDGFGDKIDAFAKRLEESIDEDKIQDAADRFSDFMERLADDIDKAVNEQDSKGNK